jgi:methyl-accepting chemotaxis protein
MTLDERSEDTPSLPTTPPPDFRVLLAAGGMVALVVVGVSLALVLMFAVRAGADEVERHARYAAAIDAAALHAKGMATNERGFLIDGNENFIEQMEGRTELVRAAFASALEAADDHQRATVAEAREGFERWLEGVEEEVAVYRSGDEEGAVEMSLGTVRNLRWTYEGWLADAKSLGTEGFQDATAQVDGTSTISTVVLLGYVIVASVVAAGIAMWLVRSILRPGRAVASVRT